MKSKITRLSIQVLSGYKLHQITLINPINALKYGDEKYTLKKMFLYKTFRIFQPAFRSRNCLVKTVEKQSSFIPPMASSHPLPRFLLVDWWKWRYRAFRSDVQGENENNNMNNSGHGKTREITRRKSWIPLLSPLRWEYYNEDYGRPCYFGFKDFLILPLDSMKRSQQAARY